MSVGLRAAARDYLSERRARGYRLDDHKWLLGAFLDGLDARGVTRITVAGAMAFATASPKTHRSWQAKRLAVVLPVLRHGRQYLRPVDDSGTFRLLGPGDVICWSRILDTDEALIVVNGHGTQAVGTRRVLIDADLNPAGATMTVVANTAQAANPAAFTGPHPVGSTVPVSRTGNGTTFVTIDTVGPSEVLVLVNRPTPEVGAILP